MHHEIAVYQVFYGIVCVKYLPQVFVGQQFDHIARDIAVKSFCFRHIPVDFYVIVFFVHKFHVVDIEVNQILGYAMEYIVSMGFQAKTFAYRIFRVRNIIIHAVDQEVFCPRYGISVVLPYIGNYVHKMYFGPVVQNDGVERAVFVASSFVEFYVVLFEILGPI